MLANLIVALLLWQGGLYAQQTFVDDAIMQKSAQTADPRVVIVAIDDKSIAAYGQLSSWNRAHYADLIRRLKDDGARAAAFDVAFIDPSASDAKVAEAIQYAQSSGGGPPMPVILAVVGDQMKARVAGQGLVYNQFLHITPGIAAARPIPANVNVDPDGAMVRHLPILAVDPHEHYFLLPFVAAAAYLRLPDKPGISLLPNGLQLGTEFVPTDPAYRMLINFIGPPMSFTHYSLSDVADGKVNPAALRGKLVLVGELGSTQLVDSYKVPTSAGRKMDGVEIWANGVQNLLQRKFVVDQGKPVTLALMVLLSVVAAAGFFLWGALGWLVALGVLGAYSLVAVLLTENALNASPGAERIVALPNLAYVDAAVLLSSVALFIAFFIYEQRNKAAVNQMFGKYVTPEIAQHLMAKQDRGELGLGGER
ncbi:MAG: CHASE2 domain-containing protein, partial [Chloroflexota bacterium]